MELFPVNEEKSRAAAEDVFKEYRLQRGLMSAPVNPRITSSWGDGQPTGSGSPRPYAQQLMERKQHAEAYCKWCDRCIDSLPKRSHQQLLRARYCDGPESIHPDTTAIGVLDWPSATYFRRKNEALLAAAFYLGVETA
jgi:hypothetical protein